MNGKKVLFGAGIVSAALLAGGCATNKRVKDLEAELGGVTGSLQAKDKEIAALKANSPDNIARVYKSIVGNDPDAACTPAQMRAGIAGAIPTKEGLAAQVETYNALAASGIGGIDLPGIAGGITSRYMRSIGGKQLDSVLDRLEDYAKQTGAEVMADKDATRIYVRGNDLSGKPVEYTILVLSGQEAVVKVGYTGGNTSDIGTVLTLDNYAKLTSVQESARKVAKAKGIEKVLAVADAVKRGDYKLDDPVVKQTLDAYLGSDEGKKLELAVHVGFYHPAQKKSLAATCRGNAAAAYETGAVPVEAMLALVRHGTVGYNSANPKGEEVLRALLAGRAVAAGPDVSRAMSQYDCGVTLNLAGASK